MRQFIKKCTIPALTSLSALLLLTGCATTGPVDRLEAQYGNFAPDSPSAGAKTMADDAVRRLVAVYPPAHTRFELRQATPDAFGQALIATLRNSGYALLEIQSSMGAGMAAPEPKKTANRANNGASPLTLPLPLPFPAPAPAETLHYILDLDPDSQLYRITLLIGKQSLTRAYLAQNGAMLPASAWMRKE